MYYSGSFDNFVARIHVSNTTGDLFLYSGEGTALFGTQTGLAPYYNNLYIKWATEYVKKNYSITNNTLPSGAWPFR